VMTLIPWMLVATPVILHDDDGSYQGASAVTLRAVGVPINAKCQECDTDVVSNCACRFDPKLNSVAEGGSRESRVGAVFRD